MKHFSHFNTAVQLIEQYTGDLPLSILLKSFFSQHKKYGSNDRKRIAHLCYCYFRLGHAMPSVAVEEKILAGVFLCDQGPAELLEKLKPEWNKQIQLSIDEKINVLHRENIQFLLKDIFPWNDRLSEGMDHLAFCRSFLIQPDLFLRLRPGHEKNTKQKLRNAGIYLNEISASCISLPNASKIDELIELDKEAVVQDLSSQRTGDFLTSNIQHPTSNISVWDCCAASGGKSILAYDLVPDIHLIVSDVRESIIQNLKKRFARAGIRNYQAFVIDLANDPVAQNALAFSQQAGKRPKAITISNTQSQISNPFDLIICDAPCSGSGTWSRTPEQLMFFKQESGIDHYSSLQRKIISNAIPHLKQGGRFVYITCSVFKKENEGVVEFIRNQFSLQLERIEVLKGYDKRADTLFAASFIRE